MGNMKNYLLRLVEQGTNPEQQDAIEWAILSGWVKLTYKYEQDSTRIASELGAIVSAYRRVVEQMERPVELAERAA